MVETSSIDRFESHFRIFVPVGLFCLAIYCLFYFPDDLRWLFPKSPVSERKDVQAVQVAEISSGRPISVGWLRINYQEVMRNTDDTKFEVIYENARGSTSEFIHERNFMTVSVAASSGLTILPLPTNYTFDAVRLIQSGNDNHIWTISAKRTESDNLVTVRFNVPSQLLTIVNGKTQQGVQAEFTLPVHVYKPHPFWTVIGDFAKYTGAILSFLLTLPLLSVLLTWYLEKKKKPKPKSKAAAKKKAANS